MLCNDIEQMSLGAGGVGEFNRGGGGGGLLVISRSHNFEELSGPLKLISSFIHH